MDRLDFFFRQLVTEGDMDLAFDQVQDRIESAIGDEQKGFSGIVKNGEVTESGPPALTVDVSGDALLFTPEGKQVSWPDPQIVDVSQDNLGASTEVLTPGNSRIISVFAEFAEDLQQPETDGNSVTVFFRRNASFSLFVVQSAEDVAPTAPPLRPDAILLVDITRAFGQSTITNGNLDVSRRQDFFRSTGNTRLDVVRGRTKEVLDDILSDYNAYVGELASQAAGEGATLIGIEGFTLTPTGGTALGYASATLRAAINDVITDLATAGGASNGATKVGANAKSGSGVALGSPLTLAEGTVNAQIETLLDYLETIRTTPFTAASVSFTPHDYVSSGNVQAAIEELIDDLQSTTGGLGSAQVGYDGQAGAPSFVPPVFTAPADTVANTLDFLVTEMSKRIRRGSTSPDAIRIDTASTTGTQQALDFRALSSGNMADGFGPLVAFAIEDDAVVTNVIASLAAVRAGADDTGELQADVYSGGVPIRVLEIEPLVSEFRQRGSIIPLQSNSNIGSLANPYQSVFVDTSFVVDDANFNLSLSGDDRILRFDSGDALIYSRTFDSFRFERGSTNDFVLQNGGVNIREGLVVGAVGFGPTSVDGLEVGIQNFGLFWNGVDGEFRGDSGDFIRYDRSADSWDWLIGNTEYMSLDVGSSQGILAVRAGGVANRLQLDGSFGGTGALRFNSDLAASLQVAIGSITSGDELTFRFDSNTRFRMVHGGGSNTDGFYVGNIGGDNHAIYLGERVGDPTGLVNKAQVYAKDVGGLAEVFVRDQGGTVTQISPHDPKTGEYYLHTENKVRGFRKVFRMERAIRALEELTGKTFIEEETLEVEKDATTKPAKKKK